MELKFTSFKARELEGQWVMMGVIVNGKIKKSIKLIRKATKNGFKVFDSPVEFDMLGRQKLKQEEWRQDQLSHCVLISEQEAMAFMKRADDKRNQVKKELVNKLKKQIHEVKNS